MTMGSQAPATGAVSAHSAATLHKHWSQYILFAARSRKILSLDAGQHRVCLVSVDAGRVVNEKGGLDGRLDAAALARFQQHQRRGGFRPRMDEANPLGFQHSMLE